MKNHKRDYYEEKNTTESLVIRTRKIPPSGRSTTGFYIPKSGQKLPFESRIERDAYLMLDFEPHIKNSSIIAQPELPTLGYVPDTFLQTHDNALTYLDFKYEQELVEEWEEQRIRFEHIDEYCRANNFEYGLVTDACIYHLLPYRYMVLRKIKALGSIFRCSEENKATCREILTAKDDFATVRELVQTVSKLIGVPRGSSIVLGFLRSERLRYVTPSLNLMDCQVSLPSENDSISLQMFSLKEMEDRLRTHPLRFGNEVNARIVS